MFPAAEAAQVTWTYCRSVELPAAVQPSDTALEGLRGCAFPPTLLQANRDCVGLNSSELESNFRMRRNLGAMWQFGERPRRIGTTAYECVKFGLLRREVKMRSRANLIFLAALLLLCVLTGSAADSGPKTQPDRIAYISFQSSNWDIDLFSQRSKAPKRLTDYAGLDCTEKPVRTVTV
jgi:hypothetical protein